MRATVVVVNWNGEHFLPPLLDSLKTAPADVIVVDNASSDASAEILRRYDRFRFIWNDRNVGFGKAANQGIVASKTEYVLLLNADVRLTEGSLGALEQFLNEHPDAAVVAPQLLFSDGEIQPSCRTFPSIWKCFLFLSFLDRVVPSGYRLSIQEHSQTREVDQPMGAALLIRKSALNQVGTFDPAFFMYMEDVDLCERLKNAGWKIYLHPEAKIVHHAGGSSNQDWERSQMNYLESLVHYFRKRSGSFRLALLKGALMIALWVRSIVLLFAGRTRQSRFYLGASFRIMRL